MEHERELELTISWKSGASVNFKTVDNPQFDRINLNAPSKRNDSKSYASWVPEGSSGKNITIYDCLSCFGQEETLAGNDKWYCSKCKDHVPAFKKVELYRTPEILCVHFKRFSF